MTPLYSQIHHVRDYTEGSPQLLPLATTSALALLSEGLLERLLVFIDVSQVALGIDKGVRISGPSLLQLGVLFREVIERCVRTDPQIDREGAGLLIGGPEVIDDSGVVVEGLEEPAVQAALDEGVVGFAVFLQVHRPGETALRVTGHDVSGQCGPAERDRFAVIDHAVDRMFLTAGSKLCGPGRIDASDDYLRAR